MTFMLSSNSARSFMTIDTKAATLGRPRSNSKSSSLYAWAPHSAKSLKFGFDATPSPSPRAVTFNDVSYHRKATEVPSTPWHVWRKAPLPTRPFQVLPLPRVEEQETDIGHGNGPVGARPSLSQTLSTLVPGQRSPFTEQRQTPPPAYEEVDSGCFRLDRGRHISLLLTVDPAIRPGPSQRQPHRSPALRDVISKSLPEHLHTILSWTGFEYEAVTQCLTVSLFKDPRRAYSKTRDEALLSSIQSISELEVDVGEWCSDLSSVELCWSFIVWCLAWIGDTRRGPLASINVSVPETFDAVRSSNSISQLFGKRTPTLNSTSISWVGGICPLHYLLLSFSTEVLQELHITTELSVDEALILLRAVSRFRIHTLSIGTLVACSPMLVPAYPTRKSANPGWQVLAPLSLLYIDSLKVSSTVDLAPLFEGLSLPRLCKLELDVVEASVEVFDGIIDLPLVWDQIIYFDVVHDVEIERNYALRGVLQNLSPEAYVATNGEGGGGRNCEECLRSR